MIRGGLTVSAFDTIAFDAPGASGEAEPTGEPPGRRLPRRTVIVVSVALAVSLVVGGAAFAGAWVWFGWGGTQPEQVVPSSTGLFLRIDLQPGLGQELKLDDLAGRFPDEDASSAVDQLRRGLLRGMGLEALDFDTDIAPWFANRVGVGLWSPEASKPACVLLALASKDDGKAATALRKVREAARSDRYGFTFLSGYAVSAECPRGGGQATAEAAVSDAKTRSLAQRPAFSDELSRLPGGQMVVGWADLDAVPDLIAVTESLESGAGIAGIDALRGQLLAGARVVDNGVEVRYRLRGDAPARGARNVVPELGALPADTIIGAALDLSSGEIDALRDQIDAALDGFGGVAEIVFGGVDVLLGSTLSLAVTSIGDDGERPTFQLLVQAPTANQAESVEDLLEALRRALVVAGTADGLSVEREGSRVTVTSGDFRTGGRLADSSLFREAMAGITGTPHLAAFVDVQGLAPSLGLGAAGEQRMKPVRAVGLTIGSDGVAKVGLLRVVIR